MTVQELTVRQTQKALDDLIRAVEALPEDKRGWSPGESGRSALDQLKEVAMVPVFYVAVLQSGAPSPELHGSLRAEAESLTSFEEVQQLARERTADLCARILSFPESRLDEEVTLPFNRGMTVTMADVLGLHYWNTVYHLGQVNFIQTLLGDREMH